MHSISRRFAPTRCSKTVMRWLAMWVVVTVLVLLSVDVSTATLNPLHHPLQNSQNHHGSNYDRNVHVVGRGGSTILQPPPQEQQQQQYLPEEAALSSSSSRSLLEQPQYQQQQEQQVQQQPMVNSNNNNPTSFLPRVRLEQITKALLHTSEWNRRLLRGIKHWGKHERINLVSSSSSPSAQPSIAYANNGNYPHEQLQHSVSYQNYGSLPVNVHPSRTWQPPIEQDSGRSLEEEELTLFHAKASNEARSWGPDLQPYLKHICEILEIEDDNIELVLAMIYLDRACSVDTPRSNGIAHCPFVHPRTVHRLGLAALVVAKSSTISSQNLNDMTEKLSSSLGIPKEQLQLMVEWMVGALGDDATYVGVPELHSWSNIWKKFVSKFKL